LRGYRDIHSGKQWYILAKVVFRDNSPYLIAWLLAVEIRDGHIDPLNLILNNFRTDVWNISTSTIMVYYYFEQSVIYSIGLLW